MAALRGTSCEVPKFGPRAGLHWIGARTVDDRSPWREDRDYSLRTVLSVRGSGNTNPLADPGDGWNQTDSKFRTAHPVCSRPTGLAFSGIRLQVTHVADPEWNHHSMRCSRAGLLCRAGTGFPIDGVFGRRVI